MVHLDDGRLAARPPPWHASAAYLYVLHLDGPALAWEYLRRHPGYRLAWLTQDSGTAKTWGLRTLEDPALDAREALPDWLNARACAIRVIPDDDPAREASPFVFWRLPGRKQLQHDGRGLVLSAHWPGCCVRLVLAPELHDGMPHAFAMHACREPCTRYLDLAKALDQLATASRCEPSAATCPRPSPSTQQALLTLQALDANQAGASLREIAEGLFGSAEVVSGWHADSALRARVRRLVQRGRSLMDGGYRELAGIDPLAPPLLGRNSPTPDRP
ncbi:DNA -binding domain-containing protein [Hydrogenophaga luteola]|uniref:DNA -binding domain-containing protein n=1 Tax=Hydrogenophaga luteola TaxID=1591122 RepID=A0ABV7W0J5_9BURK